MTHVLYFKITINDDKKMVSDLTVLEEPVLDTYVDGREFFLASNNSRLEASENVTIEGTPDKENNKIVCNRTDFTILKENDGVLNNNRILSYNGINALQIILNQESPDVNGLQGPILRQTPLLKVIDETPFVQVWHSQGFHWVVH